MQENKNKPGKRGRKFLDYPVKMVNFRIDTRLIDRMNAEKINKTELIHQLLRQHYKLD